MTNGIQQLADNLAEFGRYGDTYMVHAAEGETVVPAEILEANPNLKDQLFRQMQLMGIQDPNRYVVGNTLNSINPITGQPEFFFKKLFKKVVKVAKVAAPIVVGAVAGPAAGAAVAGGIGALEGKSIDKILGSATSAYFGSQALACGVEGFQGAPQGSTFLQKLGSGFTGAQQNLSLDPRQSKRIGIGQLFGRDPEMGKEAFRKAFGEFTEAGREAKVKELAKKLQPEKAAQSKGRGLAGVTDFLKSETGKNILGAVLPVGAGLLAAKYQSDFNKQRTDPNPQQTAAQAYFSTPLSERGSAEAIENRRLAAIMPAFNASELARITGIDVGDAQSYLRSAYPGEVLAAMGGEIVGPGTGTSDSIPARLSDGEFVLTAQAVRGAGNGERDLGAARMYDLMSRFERMA